MMKLMFVSKKNVKSFTLFACWLARFLSVCSEEKKTWQVVGAVGCLILAFSLIIFP